MALIRCENCKLHKYQDTKYGKDIRVANKTIKLNGFRCTVCEKLVNKALVE